MLRARQLLSACVAPLLLATALAAQCADAWQPGGTWDAAPSLFATTADGDLIAAGEFTIAGGVPCTRIARRVDGQWTPLGAGMSLPITSLATLPDGDVIAISGGEVQRWDGNTWTTLPLPPTTTQSIWVERCTVTTEGELYAGGGYWDAFNFYGVFFVHWTGSGWEWMPSPSSIFYQRVVGALCATSDGDLYTVTETLNSPPVKQLFRWDSSAWQYQAVWPGIPPADMKIAPAPSGGVLVSGNGFVHWDGVTATPLGPLPVNCFAALPDGDIVAGGSFTSPSPGIARWDGTQWTAMGGGLDSAATAVAFDPEGGVIASGPFTTAGGQPSPLVARYVTSCPASAPVHVAGCASSVGVAHWTAPSGPWIGSTWRSTCAPLPPVALAVEVIGFLSMPQPLPALLPQGLPGCSLVPTVDGTTLHVVQNGAVESTIAVPDLPIAGLQAYQQLITFELDAAGNIAAVTGSDTLQLTVGTF
ncbi:MAG: hypothetical protein R3F29_12825 [Planctomycetota bacterium]